MQSDRMHSPWVTNDDVNRTPRVKKAMSIARRYLAAMGREIGFTGSNAAVYKRLEQTLNKEYMNRGFTREQYTKKGK